MLAGGYILLPDQPYKYKYFCIYKYIYAYIATVLLVHENFFDLSMSCLPGAANSTKTIKHSLSVAVLHSFLLQPALRDGALKTIKQRAIVINGPLKLVQGNFGTIARIPIFIPNSTLNETFGTSRNCKWPTSVLTSPRVCTAFATVAKSRL